MLEGVLLEDVQQALDVGVLGQDLLGILNGLGSFKGGLLSSFETPLDRRWLIRGR